MSEISQYIFNTQTNGRGMLEITKNIVEFISTTSIVTGLCNVFLHHTSASLLLCENSDPDVQSDLERFFSRLVPDGDSIYKHVAEGVDDMSAHVRSVLTTNSLTIPITESRLALGTWQGIYLWEHRNNPYKRKVTVTVQG